jgi:hypothetical protein
MPSPWVLLPISPDLTAAALWLARIPSRVRLRHFAMSRQDRAGVSMPADVSMPEVSEVQSGGIWSPRVFFWRNPAVHPEPASLLALLPLPLVFSLPLFSLRIVVSLLREALPIVQYGCSAAEGGADREVQVPGPRTPPEPKFEGPPVPPPVELTPGRLVAEARVVAGKTWRWKAAQA